ncbi:MAG TPA: alpha/beta fold hydrolase [Ktedonobacterales bacterium]|nr:alpha/beta fold hydrolase [Ktedonobacterales bacterium]
MATKSYSEELVYAATEDDISLAGVVIRPVGVPVQSASIVWIHGNAATFYDHPYVLVGRELAALGYTVVSGNTRGHDIATTLWRASDGTPFAGGGGAGWELMEDAHYDLAAWVKTAHDLQAGGVVLVGHSAGAHKVVLYAAVHPGERIAGIALASPDLRGFRIPGELEVARQLVAEGRGMEVLPAQPFAPWYRQSARTLVSRAEAADRVFNATGESVPALEALRVPVLAFYGDGERNAEDELDAIRRAATGAPSAETRLIAGAGHFYTGHEANVARTLAEWAATLR